MPLHFYLKFWWYCYFKFRCYSSASNNACILTPWRKSYGSSRCSCHITNPGVSSRTEQEKNRPSGSENPCNHTRIWSEHSGQWFCKCQSSLALVLAIFWLVWLWQEVLLEVTVVLMVGTRWICVQVTFIFLILDLLYFLYSSKSLSLID